ncbi:MAG TPA: glycosyltransferase 87 family protein [Gaiellaceae bacterium]|nr:glycosyltransferase 87 family protein [Gaiellaceae bacterium]
MRTLRAAALGWVVFLGACSLPNVGLWDAHGKADTGLYESYGAKVVNGHLPYGSGFSLEFPPGAIPALAVPALPRSSYVVWFKLFAFGCGLAAVAAVAAATAGAPSRRQLPAVLAAAVAPALLGPITLNSFDLWPAALAGWAVALVVRGRSRWGVALLGAATAAKLYPLLLAPVLLTHVVRTRGAREGGRAFAAGAAVVVAAFAPFLALAPGGLGYSLRRQATRGLQVESLGGSILGAAHRLGAGFHVTVTHAPFSFDIAGSAARALASVSSVVLLVAVLAIWRRHMAAEGARRSATLRAAAASAVAFVAFAKVLSPQYLLFLVPLVPAAGSLAATGLFLLALGLTQVWARFPEPFLELTHLGAFVWAALARNLVLVVLYAVLLRGLRARRATSTP